MLDGIYLNQKEIIKTMINKQKELDKNGEYCLKLIEQGRQIERDEIRKKIKELIPPIRLDSVSFRNCIAFKQELLNSLGGKEQ